MKALLFGSDTTIGQAIQETWPDLDVVGLRQDDVSLTHPLDVSRTILLYRPNVVVNCVEKSDRQWCETHADEANMINGTAVGYIAKVCEAQRLTFIQISSAEASSAPATIYGQSKLHGELQAKTNCHRLYIVRWPAIERATPEANQKTSLFAKSLLQGHAAYGLYQADGQVIG